MGWYDAFKGDTNRASRSAIDALDNSSALKNLGDAFVTLSKDSREADKDAQKTQLLNLQSVNEQNKIDDHTDTKRQTKLDDAFKTSVNSLDGTENIKLFKDHYQDGNGYGNISPTAIAEADKQFQGKFNDEAVNVAVSGGYKDFDAFSKANPELVKNADGLTMAKIDKHFSDKDMTEATNKSAEASANQARALLRMQERINKAEGKSATSKSDSISAQNTLEKMIDNDYIVKNAVSGKPEYLDGKTPEERDFVQGFVHDYMYKDGSDKNVYNAKKQAQELWQQGEAERKAKAGEEQKAVDSTKNEEMVTGWMDKFKKALQ